MFIAPTLAFTLASQPASASETLHGTITLVDNKGHVIADASGRFVLHASFDVDYSVAFTKGVFDVEVGGAPSGWFEVYGVRSNHGDAIVNSGLVFRVPGPIHDLHLGGELLDPCFVRVLDAESGLPLDCVELGPLRATRDRSLDADRIRLDPLVDDDEFLRDGTYRQRFRSPGYVDAFASIDPRVGGAHSVYLQRGGSLGFQLVGYSPTMHTIVDVVRLSDEFSARCRVDPRAWPLYRDLEPGAYVVRVVHEWLDGRRVTLAEKRVDVLVDCETWETIRLAPADPDPYDRLRYDWPWELNPDLRLSFALP